MTDKEIVEYKPRPALHLPANHRLANPPAVPVPKVPRHRAAIRRNEFSLPVKCLLRDGLLDPADSLFDYGCGHGDDLRSLETLGYVCDGWDPVHRPDTLRRPADVVNLGFVLNVIEAPDERLETLRDAWSICRKLLVVAARVAGGDGLATGGQYGDGVVTRLGTFQKLYGQSELREYVQAVLEAEALPAAPGVFYVFKDGELSQRYFAARYRRRGAAPRQRISERRFEENRALLEPLLAKIAGLGRLPFPDEWPETGEVINAIGSLKRAFALIRVTGDQPWNETRQQRIDDLTVYLALSRFRKRPPLSALPLDLQRDIREFFGSYKRACETADAILFQTGDPSKIDQACRESPLGRLTSNALLVHQSALDALSPLLRIYEGCARAYLGEIDDAAIVKLHRFSGKVSYLACPEFDEVPHPAIRRTVKLTLSTRQLDCRDHSDAPSPLVLDRKETFVAPDYPNRDRFARFTEHERARGLLDDAEDLATMARWQEHLDQAGLELRGKRLVWKAGQKRRRPLLRAAVGQDETTVEPPEESRVTAPVQSPTAEDQDQPRQRSSRYNRAQAGIPGNEPTVSVPSRSRHYGIGKEIGGSVYVHRQYEQVLGAAVASAKRSLPRDFQYDVVKFNHRTQAVSFIQCPRFDHDPEPAIAAAIIVRPDGTKRLREFRADDPPIYHHKWLFVADDYSGFDIEESKRRSAVLRQDERCSKVLVRPSDFGRSGKRILGKGMTFSRHAGIVWPQPA